MSVLHLDNVPDELLQRIKALAAVDQIPVAEETVHLLKEAIARKQPSGLSADRLSVVAILEQIRRNPIIPAPGTPDSLELLREDRRR